MRYCARCKKVLSRQTKGDRCLQCYRNRNNTLITDATKTAEFSIDDIEIHSPHVFNSSNVDDIIPLFNDNVIDNRAVINLLKKNMIDERMRDVELIETLKSQIDFLKDEVVN